MTTFLNNAKLSRNPEKLAEEFLRTYFKNEVPVYPLNPFQMLKDIGVEFVLKRFKKLEGIYVPASSDEDMPFVGINSERPIVRQRFTAAHELCHHLRDADKHVACPIGQKDEGEIFADKFAAALLMPIPELKRQVKSQKTTDLGYISFDVALEIADYFGVSFESCVFRLAYKLHAIDGDIEPDELKKRIAKYKPYKKRKEKNMHSLKLYEGLINAYSDILAFQPTEHARLVFQNTYIYNDSRMEGIKTTSEAAAEIVADLRLNMQNSQYCMEENEAYLSIAGHYSMYQDIFATPVDRECSVFDMFGLHRKLFSHYPNPEYGGTLRQSNTLVLGAKFETIPFQQIYKELLSADEMLQELFSQRKNLTLSEFIEGIVKIHHRLTVIHPFGDGNGRTLRAFLNMILVRNQVSPLYIKADEKDEYVTALSLADTKDSYVQLYECIFKCLLRSNVDLNSY